MQISQTIAQELNVNPQQVESAINLLDDGATVPFIARYRKEATGGLDDTQLRNLEERLLYLREMEERRGVILKSIEEQGKLSDPLKKQINDADNKARLEDLYAPYKPKRRTKAQIAIEAGLEPLADTLLKLPSEGLEALTQAYLDDEKGIKKHQDALDGARFILIERFSENADLLQKLRQLVWDKALIESVVIKDKETEGKKFADYFDYKELIKKCPSHRALALFRGQKEGFLRLSLVLEEAENQQAISELIQTFNLTLNDTESGKWLKQTIDLAWKAKLKLKIDLDLFSELKSSSEMDAIDVFRENLKNLLMASPAGELTVLGLDPGLRTGVKVVVVDSTGKLLEYQTIFPHAPKNQWDHSLHQLQALCQKHNVNILSIGNGTASRETDKLAADLIKKNPELNLQKIVISEAGASVYSASQLAADEFPDLDVSYRGAVSIARRLQDPLAELVKIEPKSIGVGQYQHDVNQVKLNRSLKAVVEDCVNAVGADINTASVPLLKSISGLNESIAQNIVLYRDQHGRFKSRDEIRKVPRLGDKTFEQAAGFLRIIGGENVLDASAVHPESYPLVENIISKVNKPLPEIMGNASLIDQVAPKDLVNDDFGLPTVEDILTELKKPGRDPRPEFKMATFKEGVEKLEDLKDNMILEGAVTNVTHFGAFVDIGVHQDGLVHISELSDKFVDNPNKIVKVGDLVKVRVIEVDKSRRRIQLSMRTQESSGQSSGKPTSKQRDNKGKAQHKGGNKTHKKEAAPTLMQQALLDAFK